LFLLVLSAFLVVACASTAINNKSTAIDNKSSSDEEGNQQVDFKMANGDVSSDSPTTLHHVDKWGVRVIGVRPSAAGYMLDFRYRVLDAKKAAEVVNRKNKPYLLVEKDGSKLVVPVTSKLGPLRQSAQYAKENRNYFMFFANPGKHVKSGDLVTVVIGDFKAEHIVVN